MSNNNKNPKEGEPNVGDKIKFIQYCDGRFSPGDIALVEEIGDNGFGIWLKDLTNNTQRDRSHGNVLVSDRSHGNVLVSGGWATILPYEPPIKLRNRFDIIRE